MAEDARLAALLEVALSLLHSLSRFSTKHRRFLSFLRSCNRLGLSLPVASLPSLWVSSESRLTHAKAYELAIILEALRNMNVKPPVFWFSTFWKAFQSALSDCGVDTLSVTLRACVALNATPPSNLLAERMQTSNFKGDPVHEVASSNVLYTCAFFSQWPSSSALAPIWNGLREKQCHV